MLTLLAVATPARADDPLSLSFDFAGNADFFATGAAMAVDGPDDDSDVDALLHPALTQISADDLPEGAALRDAFLYWGGSIADTNNCGDPQALDDRVTFTPPGGEASEVVAEVCRCSDAGANNYDIQVCRANITLLLEAGLIGEYAVDDFAALVENGGTNNASFSIVLVYTAPSLPTRRVAIYDGLLTMWDQAASEEVVVLDGIEIDDPPSGDLTWYALEGDLGGLGMEGVEVVGGPGGLSLALTDAFNPVDNPMNRSINTTTPPQTDAVGVDIDQFDIGAALTAGDTSVEITYRSGSDKYWIAYNIVGVNVFAPEFGLSSGKSWELQEDLDMDGVPSVGDVIRYTVGLDNQGNASGVVTLEDMMPPQVESWELVDAGGGVDMSMGDTLLITQLAVDPGASTEIMFDVVIAAGTEGQQMVNVAVWEAPPDGGAGEFQAPAVPIADDPGGDGDGDGDPAGDGDGDDSSTSDSGSGTDTGTDSDSDSDSGVEGTGSAEGETGDGLPGLGDDGCNCSADSERPAGLAFGLLGLLGLLGLRRRRALS